MTAKATVLTKKAPVYDYGSGHMRWTVEVDAAGLPMEDVELTDELPAGLTYVEDSLVTDPVLPAASGRAEGQTLTIRLGDIPGDPANPGKTTVTFDTEVNPEALRFDGDQPAIVENTVRMNGRADGVPFAEVSSYVRQSFTNHGLVKSSTVNNQQEFIQYEVLINPYRLALPESPSLVDTLDRRLQLDDSTLRFYKAELEGTTADKSDQRPGYKKIGTGEALDVTGFDPDENRFSVRLPIRAGDRDAYVLAYTADIIDYQRGGYGNSVRFDGGSALSFRLGGVKTNSASVGGGGGGGDGVAARKAIVTIVKTKCETGDPLSGVSFLLYRWDSGTNQRGLPFAKGETDANGELSFKVTPGAAYELVETESAPGYSRELHWTGLPDGVRETANGLLIPGREAQSVLTLNLTNEAAGETTEEPWELTIRKVTGGSPLAGAAFGLYADADCRTLLKTGVSGQDGTIVFPGLERGQRYWVRETAAPSGYELNPTVYEAGEEHPVLVISNAPASVNPETPGGPETSGESGTPGGPETSGESGSPSEPGTPGKPGAGSELGTPIESGAVSEPGIPGEPGAPGEAGVPSEPGAPGEAGVSNEADVLGESDAPGESDASGESSVSGDAGVPDVPQTGDDAGLWMAAAGLSGMLLALAWRTRRKGAKT